MNESDKKIMDEFLGTWTKDVEITVIKTNKAGALIRIQFIWDHEYDDTFYTFEHMETSNSKEKLKRSNNDDIRI